MSRKADEEMKLINDSVDDTISYDYCCNHLQTIAALNIIAIIFNLKIDRCFGTQ